MVWLFARCFLLRLVTLCIAFGVLWAPVAEATDCAEEPAVAFQLEQHGETGGENSGLEKHSACAHGHCHHTSQAIGNSWDTFALGSVVGVLRAADQAWYASGLTELATPPPRA